MQGNTIKANTLRDAWETELALRAEGFVKIEDNIWEKKFIHAVTGEERTIELDALAR